MPRSIPPRDLDKANYTRFSKGVTRFRRDHHFRQVAIVRNCKPGTADSAATALEAILIVATVLLLSSGRRWGEASRRVAI